ncbi:MAG: N-acetylmuramoyl-L-alanine amidase, partial [Lachnospiraceae bacterium]|nr:N-acetylmuramoyl-L-alanine amidase [Lachnospiraceae bacterium]
SDAGASSGTASSDADSITKETVSLDKSWKYAEESKINTGKAVLYHAKPSKAKGKTVCINAGHGTKGGSSVKTKCHPDGTPKVTGGTTASGETEAVAVSSGVDMADGTPEAAATLSLAKLTRNALLKAGYDVLMIREKDDVQLDNIARTVLANNLADCHIALHYDYTDTDKGAYFMSVPDVESYRNMEPVKSHWEEHMALGRAVVSALKDAGFKLFEGGELEMDLTQTSYSTVPSIDLEVGDKVSDISEENQAKIAKGIVAGLDKFFE